jgi:hypothetical protein
VVQCVYTFKTSSTHYKDRVSVCVYVTRLWKQHAPKFTGVSFESMTNSETRLASLAGGWKVSGFFSDHILCSITNKWFAGISITWPAAPYKGTKPNSFLFNQRCIIKLCFSTSVFLVRYGTMWCGEEKNCHTNKLGGPFLYVSLRYDALLCCGMFFFFNCKGVQFFWILTVRQKGVTSNSLWWRHSFVKRKQEKVSQ